MGSAVSSIANIFTGSSNTKAAGEAAAAQQAQAARDSSAAAAFRPVGMTTRFGMSQFTRATDPATGMPYISSAGYAPAPELAGIQDRLFGGFGGGADFAQQQAAQFGALSPAAQQLFGAGADYLATSPEEAAQKYMAQQRELLAPGYERQLAGIRNQVYQTGRGGLATGGTAAGGMIQSNPELAAFYNAQSQREKELAAEADIYGRQRFEFGAGLFGKGAGFLGTQAQGISSAYSPLQTQLGVSGQVEQMAQMPYQLGLQLGQAQQPGQTAGAQMYQQGINQSAQTQYGATQAANAANAQFWGGLIGATGTAAAGGAFGRGGPTRLA